MNGLQINQLPDLMNTHQVGQYMGVSKATVHSWISLGLLPSFKIGNTRRIKKDALIEHINELETR